MSLMHKSGSSMLKITMGVEKKKEWSRKIVEQVVCWLPVDIILNHDKQATPTNVDLNLKPVRMTF